MTLTLFNIYFNSLSDKNISSAVFYVKYFVKHFPLFLFHYIVHVPISFVYNKQV